MHVRPTSQRERDRPIARESRQACDAAAADAGGSASPAARTCWSSGPNAAAGSTAPPGLPRVVSSCSVRSSSHAPALSSRSTSERSTVTRPLAGWIEAAQPAVEFGGGHDQPFTGRCEDQRSGLFEFNECTGDGRHEVQGFRLRLSAAKRGLSNYKKSGYPATTSVSIPATGSSPRDYRGTTRMDLKQHIRSIPDFPKPGILFYDISTLLAHPKAWQSDLKPRVARSPVPQLANARSSTSIGTSSSCANADARRSR